jgi:hypothetical protein
VAPTAAQLGPEYEVVIYDPVVDESMAVDPVGDRPEDADEAADGPPLVPLPTLELPAGTLIAGTPITVVVRLPQSPRRLAVKFWMTDIQSRSLIEKPRWLMTWSAVEEDAQESLLQLQVPLGCLEARFEAIAIDLTNQQESHKVTHTRAIIPPHLAGSETDSSVNP